MRRPRRRKLLERPQHKLTLGISHPMAWKEGDDTFRCMDSGFEVTKPSSWYFMPGAWMKPGQERLVAASEQGQAQFASLRAPLVAFRKAHDVSGEMCPTAQVRRSVLPLDVSAPELAASVRASLPDLLQECRLLELSDTAILAGRRGVRFCAEYVAVSDTADGERVACDCRVTSHAIRIGPYVITLAVTTPIREDLRESEDVGGIFASARVAHIAGMPNDGW